jgi:hypothetical protein
VFSPVSTHLGHITPAPVVHFKISTLRIHLIPRTLSIVMICPKRHTTKGVTQKVAPTHSPPAAPDVTKKGRKPPKICKDIPWSPTKVVRRKLAPPPDTTVYLMHLKEMSPPSPLLPAASKLVTGACSAAAAASTNLYCQLYSAKDNNHKGEEFYSADDKGNNNN